jgi:hypothetical protein|tara:strand:+ start:1294 stop:1734 length:441 start_codon:yes stop_codon:yes gene_type:complete
MPKAKEIDFKDIAKNIDFNRLLLTVVPLLQPFIIFGAWLTFARMNTKASIVSKIIAIAEPIPTIDLNVPKEVVLASLFDFTEDTLQLIEKIIDTLIDVPADVAETIDNLKKGIVTVDTPVGEVDVGTDDLWEYTKKELRRLLLVVT